MHNPRPLQTAGAASAPTGLRRRPQLTQAEQLGRLSSRLDQLIYQASLGIRSQQIYDRLATEAEEIATEIRGVFRETPTPEAVHPPLWQRGNKAAW